jgi:triosephosphate isomerase
MPKSIVGGNWKMNTTLQEAVSLTGLLKDNLKVSQQEGVVLCPPFVYLSAVKDILRGSEIRLGAQDVYFQPKGAFTGEISVGMLKDIGCDYVIIGHSERRQIFKEDNDMVNKKLKSSLQGGVSCIFCVGETLEQRQENLTEKTIRQQIEAGLDEVPSDRYNQIVIAYEPVWAIGTGKNATPEQAQEVHSFIRKLLTHLSNEIVAREMTIIYGGSVTADNIQSLMEGNDINGALVGGASLSADSFTKIVNIIKNSRP